LPSKPVRATYAKRSFVNPRNPFVTEKLFAPAEPSRGVLSITGADRIGFLQGLVSNDMRRVEAGQSVWAALLTAQGKFLHDFFVSPFGEALLIDGEGERIADLRKRLTLYKLRAKVVIEDKTSGFEVWHGWGQGAAEAFGVTGLGQASAIGDGIAFADPRLAALGIRLIVPVGTGADLLTAHGFKRTDGTEWDRLRLTLGVPQGSQDMVVEKAILLENGFDELNGVAWDKGCYVGQELTARTKYRGLIKKRLIPVELSGPLPQPGTIITSNDTDAGEIRSGRDSLALALIRLEALETGHPLKAGDTMVTPRKPAWTRF
jgi:folate-binding protein YgfZ